MDTVLTGAIALIKVDGVVIGRMKTIRCQEQIRREEVRGIGTILPSEAPVTQWSGSLSCEFIEVKFEKTGIPNAIQRRFTSATSRVLTGQDSFEDQLVLDTEGVSIDVYKKVTDIIDPITKVITPKVEPYASVHNVLIESDSFDISEGGLAGHSQSFKYLTPVTYG